jgi:hypothetical protein
VNQIASAALPSTAFWRVLAPLALAHFICNSPARTTGPSSIAGSRPWAPGWSAEGRDAVYRQVSRDGRDRVGYPNTSDATAQASLPLGGVAPGWRVGIPVTNTNASKAPIAKTESEARSPSSRDCWFCSTIASAVSAGTARLLECYA